MPLSQCYLVNYTICFSNHEEIIDLLKSKVSLLHWYSIVNKITGTEILVNIMCKKCKTDSPCLDHNDDNIFFLQLQILFQLKLKKLLK